ncbi:MAG: hypothetical protein OXC11_01280, partial [Rhodospirillales bacterium]|nr:hypothetical protein [Rhodospirillales bacterium]
MRFRNRALPRAPMPQAAAPQSVRSALDEASRAARRIEDAAGRAVMLAHVAEVWWRTGDAPGRASALAALASAGDIEDDARAPALARIAHAQARRGDPDGDAQTGGLALEAARAVVDNAHRAAAFVESVDM